MKTEKHLTEKPRKHVDVGRILYIGFLVSCLGAVLCTPSYAATGTIWTKATEVMKDVYTQILSISTKWDMVFLCGTDGLSRDPL